VGKIDTVNGDVTDAASLPAAMAGADAVVHAASVVANVKESSTVNYKRINDEGTANVVAAARTAGVGRFVYMGGINTVPSSPGSYLRTRYDAEQHVKNSGLPYSILQASILFGDGAAFFTALANLAKFSPIVPVPGNGRLCFQPIWVDDVVTCLTTLLDEKGRNETIAVGGPAFYSYDVLLDLIFKTLGKRRLKLHLPMPLMRMAIATMQTVLPKPPATTATLELFSAGLDNITALDSVKTRFGFEPRSLEVELREHGI
jgi:NADH dehydrogenase